MVAQCRVINSATIYIHITKTDSSGSLYTFVGTYTINMCSNDNQRKRDNQLESAGHRRDSKEGLGVDGGRKRREKVK